MQKSHSRGFPRIKIGVGSTLCLASLGGHAADAGDTPAEIVVTGHPSVDAYTSSLQDTPQIVNVLTPELLSEQAASNVQDALKNVPGITLNAGEGGTHGDNINLRGFAASDDFFLDGLRDTGFYTRDSFDLERLEIFKGPASTLFGRGSTGGVVNQVSRMPQVGDFARGVAAFGTNHELRGSADLNYALTDGIGGGAAMSTAGALLRTASLRTTGTSDRRWRDTFAASTTGAPYCWTQVRSRMARCGLHRPTAEGHPRCWRPPSISPRDTAPKLPGH